MRGFQAWRFVTALARVVKVVAGLAEKQKVRAEVLLPLGARTRGRLHFTLLYRRTPSTAPFAAAPWSETGRTAYP
jgi:hypothetical protein